MDIARINREFSDAQNTFSMVELRPTPEGTVYARVALQTGSGTYVLSIRFPGTYPNEMPRVSVDAPRSRTRRTGIKRARSVTCTRRCGTPASTI